MNSLILNAFLKFWQIIVAKYNESFFNKVASSIGKSFDKALKNSFVVNLIVRKENSDEAYKNSIGGLFLKIWAKTTTFFKGFAKTAKKSGLIIAFKTISGNAIYYPLRFYGFIFFPIGIFSTLYAFLSGEGRLMTMLSIALSIISFILLLINDSLYTLVLNSRFISLILKIFCIETPDEKEKTTIPQMGIPFALGLISGGLCLAAGPLPVLGLISLIFAICFVFYRMDYAVILLALILPFMPTMVMVAGCLGIFLCLIIKKLADCNEIFSTDNSSMNLFVGVMGLVFALGALTSVTVKVSTKIALVYIAFLIAYFIIVKVISDKKRLMWLSNSMVIASFPVALYGIYQKFTGFDQSNTWLDTEMFESISGRVVSFFENPNVFGEYLILTIMLCIATMVCTKKKTHKFIYFIILGSLTMSMVFTYSRGCWIGIILAVALFLFIENRRLFWAGVLVGIVSLFFLPDSIISRFASVGNMADSSTSYRVYIWQGTINMLKDYFVTGIGLGSEAFNKIYPMYAYSAISAPHPHNLYLLILAETGILGFISLFAVCFIYFKKLAFVIAHPSNKQYKVMASALLSGMAGYLVQGMFDNVWYNYRVFLLFWIYIAIGTVVSLLNKREVSE